MPSSPTPRLRLVLENPGENLNTWGSILNAGAISMVDDAVAGRAALTPSGNLTLTSSNYVTDQSRMAIIDCTSGTGGTLTIPAVTKVYQVRNACSGGVLVTTGSGAVATVEAGSLATVISDGTNCYRFADAADVATCLAAAKTYTDAAAFASSSAVLPGQAGNAGNILGTNGAVANWTPLAPQATALATARNITLSGAVTGSASFNGTADAGIVTTLAAGQAVANLGFTPAGLGANTFTGSQTIGGSETINGAAATPPVAVIFSATAMTVDCTKSNVFTTTFTNNVATAPTLSGPIDGQTINWRIKQDGTGSRTITGHWPASFKWTNGTPGVLSTAANSIDILVATWINADSAWYASLSKGFA